MFWSAFALYAMRAVSFLSGLLLARLLTPDAFGLIAIVTVMLESIQIFQDVGLKQTLIVKNIDDAQILNAAFYMSLGMSILLFGFILLLAPLLASFFDEQAVIPLLRLVSVRLLINSLSTIPSALLEKDLKFRTLAWPSFLGALTFSAISIPLAITGFGAWSLAWGIIAQSLLRTSLLWRYISWRPSLNFQKNTAIGLFSYSKHIVINSLGTFLHRNLDTVMVGKVLGMSPLGYYNQAFSLTNTPPTLLMSMFAPIILPTYSQTQEDLKRLTNLHLRFVKYLSMFLIPFSVAAAVLGRDIILVLYGVEWEGAALPFQLLGTYAVVRQIAGTNGPMLMVLNKVKEWNFVVYLTLILLLLLAWPSMKWGGLLGMSILMCGLALLNCGLATSLTAQTLKFPLSRLLKLFIGPIFAGAVSLLMLWKLNDLVILQITTYRTDHLLTNLAILGAKGIALLVCYSTVVCFLDREARTDLRSSLLSIKASKLKNVWQE